MTSTSQRVVLQFHKIPLSEVSIPVNGMRNVYIDYWWSVSNDECIYTYATASRALFGAPQCNRDKRVADRASGSQGYPDFKEVRQIPFVSLPVDISDYV